jgi:hypothetical protein
MTVFGKQELPLISSMKPMLNFTVHLNILISKDKSKQNKYMIYNMNDDDDDDNVRIINNMMNCTIFLTLEWMVR